MDTAAPSFISPRAELGRQAHVLAGGFMGGEDGVDALADTAEWRATALPRMAKPNDAAEAQA